MRQIGHLPNEKQARLFGDFLFARGIRNEVERDTDSSWIIWVADEEQLEAANELLERFQRDPASPEFAREAAVAEALRSKEAKEEAAYKRRFFTGGQIFRRSRGYGAGGLTFSLIVVCVAVAFFSRFDGDSSFLRPFFISDPSSGAGRGFLPEVRAGEVWRLFTPILIHFGPLHLLFNMMWLFSLGSMIEGLQGRTRFVLLTLGLALVSNVAQYALANYPIPSPGFGGMSGVVYGLFGYIWVRGKLDPRSGFHLDPQSVILMIVWFFICLNGWVGPIANVAHGSGLALGVICGLLSVWLARNRPG
jgi:GlpG protein